MIKLAHYNDGKEKRQSHEIYLKEYAFYNDEFDLFSLNPFDVSGYGATKEEALKDFIRKMDYVLHEWEAFKKILFYTDILIDDIIEIDCFGRDINNE